MNNQPSNLYAKLLGETAQIGWAELAPFFAKGQVLAVASELDLLTVAQALAEDNSACVRSWLTAQQVGVLSDAQAQAWQTRDPDLWAVVVSPWVVVQERIAQ